VGGHIAAFRDGGHYYIPLWNWMRDTAAATGEWPRWNPWENTGVPLAGDPTAALWYPGLWLFRLPLSFHMAYNAFLALHLALAAFGAGRAAACVLAADRIADEFEALGATRIAKRLRLGLHERIASRLAAISYALGGAVLFNYSNPIYLIGAAWLPWGLASLVQWLFVSDNANATTDSTRSPGPVDGRSHKKMPRSWLAWRPLSARPPTWLPPAGLVIAMAMMVTGGDPQGAVHLVLIGIAAAWFRRGDGQGVVRRFAQTIGGLAIASVLAAIIAAPLVLPTLATLATSERTAVTGNADVFESNRYEFSIGPWRWLELAWPNVGGRMFPEHRRWFSAIPAEGRVWTPSLYAGSIPLLLALTAMFSWQARSRHDPMPIAASGRKGFWLLSSITIGQHGAFRVGSTTRWLRFILVTAWLAACGNYGLGWVWMELRGAWGLSNIGYAMSGHLGGLYWLFTSVIPGYSLFRYPAKWTVVGSLAIALLAARGWVVFASRPRLGIARLLVVAGLLTALGAAIGELFPRTQLGQRWFASIAPDDWFGPFSLDDLQSDLRSAWLSSFAGLAVLSAARWILLAAKRDGNQRQLADHQGDQRGDQPIDPPIDQQSHEPSERSSQHSSHQPNDSPRDASIGDIVSARRRKSGPQNTNLYRVARWAPTVVVAWIIIDLLSSNSWMVRWLPTEQLASTHSPRPTPQRASTYESAAMETLAVDDFTSSGERWYRASSEGWWPEAWRRSSSVRRLEETIEWERESRFPKMNLFDREAVISAEDAWNAGEWRAMLASACALGKPRGDGVMEPPLEFLRAFSVRRVAFPATAPLALGSASFSPGERGGPVGGKSVATSREMASNLASTFPVGVIEIDRPLPRAWLVRNVEWHSAPLVSAKPVARRSDDQRRRILEKDGRPRNFAHSAVVELTAGERPPSHGLMLDGRDPVDGAFACRVREESGGERTVVEGESTETALLVLNDAFDPGWTATLTTSASTSTGPSTSSRSVPVFRVNRLMRGVIVPAGRWSVDFRFRSTAETQGLWLAMGMGVPGLCLLAWIRRRVVANITASAI
jgi:hypothetical protein